MPNVDEPLSHRYIGGMKPLCFSPSQDRECQGKNCALQTRTVPATTLTPPEVFATLAKRGMEPAFLSSGTGDDPGGDFSILACRPEAQLILPNILPENNPDKIMASLAKLTAELGATTSRGDFSLSASSTLSLPFVGGWVGYVSYELGHYYEKLPTAKNQPADFPLLDFRFYRHVLTYDHQREEWTATFLRREESDEEIDSALAELLACLQDQPPAREVGAALNNPLAADFSRADYLATIRRVKDYIAAGDVYQVNIAQRFYGRTELSSLEIARRILAASPAPFAACLLHKDRALYSVSPERFFRVNAGDTIDTWPIKGTRPRGATAAADTQEREALLASEKEQAELNMITDLLRNDLGRVCEYGSVSVPETRGVAAFKNVHHTYSRVRGRLRSGVGFADLLRAMFPGGSVTGVPKVRAMEIIAECEPVSRGPYCGMIGYLGVDGRTDFNIAIRTLLQVGEKLSFHVGGGIVADSDPACEYAETLHKARGILRALGVDSL